MFKGFYIFFLFFSGVSINLFPIEKVFLDQIDLDELQLVKRVKSDPITINGRSVYRDKSCSLYYKIWSKEYWLANNFVRAFEAGFYNGLTSLTAFIYDNDGCCRGYITQAGQNVFNSNVVIIKEPSSGYPIIAPFVQQKDEEYKDFYTLLCEHITLTKYAFIDFCPSNIIMIDGYYKLIDLESVMPINEVNLYFFHCLSYPPDYKNFIEQAKKCFS